MITSIRYKIILPILFKCLRANISSISISFARLGLYKSCAISEHSLLEHFSSYLLPCKFSRHLYAFSLIKNLGCSYFRLCNTLGKGIDLGFIKLNMATRFVYILYGFVNQVSGIININFTFAQLLFILGWSITITDILASSFRIGLACLSFQQPKLRKAHHRIYTFLNTACYDFTSASVTGSVGDLRISDLRLNRLRRTILIHQHRIQTSILKQLALIGGGVIRILFSYHLPLVFELLFV